MKPSGRNTYLIFIAAYLLFIAANFLYIYFKLGNWCYPLDDSFIHMAIARNLAQHGIWGVAGEFSSTSSSPLYTVILAGLNIIFKPLDYYLPLLINTAAFALLLANTHRILNRNGINNTVEFITLSALFFFTPLPVLALSGLEHIIHILLSVIIMEKMSGHIVSDQKFRITDALMISIMTICLAGIRYESLFLIAVLAFIALIRRKYFPAALLILSGVLPIAVYGIISVQNGGMFLPNTVLLKGSEMTGGISFLKSAYFNFFNNISHAPWLLVIMIINAAILLKEIFSDSSWFRDKNNLQILVFLTVSVLHLSFAKVGWLFRYEAYLVFIGLLVAILQGLKYKSALKEIFNRKRIVHAVRLALLGIIILSPVLYRSIDAVYRLPATSGNIYEQQYQLGRFLSHSYPKEPIIINDIGAICWLSKNDIIDLNGLGNNNIARAINKKYFNQQYLDSLVMLKQVKIAVVYEDLFGKYLHKWTKAATLKIYGNYICYSDSVAFFTKDSLTTSKLIFSLQEFSPYMPKTVQITYNQRINNLNK